MNKTCTKCGETKPLDQYSAHKKAKDGYNWWCKSCMRLNAKAYAARNKDRVAATAKGYREANKEKIDARVKAWHQSNAERRREHRRKWRDANLEKARAIEKASYEKNRDARLEAKREYAANNRPRYVHYTQKRKVAQGRATPSWANTEAIVAIYEECARVTVETGVEHHVDHIYPLQGKTVCGLHVESNLQILSGKENREKYNKFDC
jgi:hypothetical protein